MGEDAAVDPAVAWVAGADVGVDEDGDVAVALPISVYAAVSVCAVGGGRRPAEDEAVAYVPLDEEAVMKDDSAILLWGGAGRWDVLIYVGKNLH